MASIFASGVIFVAIIFYFKFGQKLTAFDLFGTLMMLVCVALITTGGYFKNNDPDSEVKEIEKRGLYLALTIITALMTGMIFALNTMHVQMVIESGFNIDQANYDGNLLYSILTLIVWTIDKFSANPLQSTTKDFFIANIVIMFVVTGVILFGNAV